MGALAPVPRLPRSAVRPRAGGHRLRAVLRGDPPPHRDRQPLLGGLHAVAAAARLPFAGRGRGAWGREAPQLIDIPAEGKFFQPEQGTPENFRMHTLPRLPFATYHHHPRLKTGTIFILNNSLLSV